MKLSFASVPAGKASKRRSARLVLSVAQLCYALYEIISGGRSVETRLLVGHWLNTDFNWTHTSSHNQSWNAVFVSLKWTALHAMMSNGVWLSWLTGSDGVICYVLLSLFSRYVLFVWFLRNLIKVQATKKTIIYWGTVSLLIRLCVMMKYWNSSYWLWERQNKLKGVYCWLVPEVF